MALLPILGAVGQIGSSLLGGLFSSGDRAESLRLAKEAYDELTKIGLPPDQALPIIFQQFEQAGMYTPEMEQQIVMETSKVGEIQEDPNLRLAQINALEELQSVGKGGLRPEDRAVFNQMRAEVARDLQGKIGQIQQNFQSRGVGGQGAELAAQLIATQAGADRSSAEGDRISAEASKRALEALMQSGSMAGQVRGQDFDIARTKASAQDEIARFNAANSMAIQARNIDAKNQAAMRNLAEKQRMMDANIAMRNQELLRQRQGQMANWQSQLARQQAISGAKLGLSGVYGNQAQQTAQNFQNIGAGIGGAATSLYNQQLTEDFLNRMGGGRTPMGSMEYNPVTPSYSSTQQQNYRPMLFGKRRVQ